MKTVSVIMPVYNEEKTINSILREVENSDIGDIKKEIIIVDDFSTDGTREILSTLAKEGKYKIFFQNKNKGKGAAVRLGFSHATGDYLIVQDADLEYNPNEYSNLLAPLVSGKADVVFGSRFMGDKAHRVLLYWHYVGNKLLTFLSNIFTGLNLTDMETCYKVFTKDAIKKILPSLHSNRFGIEPEITALVSEYKLRIYEVGISYSGRTYNEGKKISWKDGFSAIWTIIKTKARFSSFGKDRYKLVLLLLLAFFAVFSPLVLHPKHDGGDSLTYVESIGVLKTHIVPTGFTPNRIVSTFIGLETIINLEKVTGNLFFSWLLINQILYVIIGLIFYSLLLKILKNNHNAFISTLFLALNYSILNFGLAYLMDIGGWLFYLSSIFFSYKYFVENDKKSIWIASVLIGIGGLWKEYAFLAYVVLIPLIVINDWGNSKKILKKVFISGIIAFVPFMLLNLYVFFSYKYTYADWFAYQSIYVYKSRIIEYIKSFGSLYNFGWFIFIPGLYLLISRSKAAIKNKDWSKTTKDTLFIWFFLLSSLPFFIWPAITQRVLFITIPGVVMISALFINSLKNRYFIYFLLFLYILSSFFMDAYILKVINISSLF